MGERFFHKLWQGTAPLVVWAAHFFFCYLYAAAACGRGTWAVLAGVTLAALAAAGRLAWQAWPPGGRPRGMLQAARLGGAILALVAIAWGALPLAMFGACA